MLWPLTRGQTIVEIVWADMSHREQLLGESQQQPTGSEGKLWRCVDIRNFHHICPSAEGIPKEKLKLQGFARRDFSFSSSPSLFLQTHCQWREASAGRGHKAEEFGWNKLNFPIGVLITVFWYTNLHTRPYSLYPWKKVYTSSLLNSELFLRRHWHLFIAPKRWSDKTTSPPRSCPSSWQLALMWPYSLRINRSENF